MVTLGQIYDVWFSLFKNGNVHGLGLMRLRPPSMKKAKTFCVHIEITQNALVS